MSQFEHEILNNLLTNPTYGKKVIAYLSEDYFEDAGAHIVKAAQQFYQKYTKIPSKKIVQMIVDEMTILNETKAQIDGILSQETDSVDYDWMVDETEKFCQQKALFKAIKDSIPFIQEENYENRGQVAHLVQEALTVGFDKSIGHDYIEDAEKRWEFYNREEEKIPLGIPMLDQITKGGWARKTLNILLAGTHVGKTLLMCNFAAENLMRGQNVLYITCEMSEEKIAERIDANLLNIPIQEVDTTDRTIFMGKIDSLKKKARGRLKIKEYPTSVSNVNHYRALLQELKLHEDFVPDVVYVDYLNIASSVRFKSAENSYGYVKAISEELRGFAVENNVALITATQTNRSGASDSDPEMDATAESFGVPMTADFLCALISTEELRGLGQILVKQLKNRYRDFTLNNRFVLGMDYEYMRLYDTDNAEEGLIQRAQTSSPENRFSGVT